MPSVAVPKETGFKGDKPHYPTVYIPANEDINDVFKLDDDAVVLLKGKIKGIVSNKNQYQGEKPTERHELTLEVHEVFAYPDDGKNEFSKMADEYEAEAE